jgi:hypothetical protein
MSNSIARVTEYWLDGSVHTYEMARDELRLHMPEHGARVVVMWDRNQPAPAEEAPK